MERLPIPRIIDRSIYDPYRYNSLSKCFVLLNSSDLCCEYLPGDVLHARVTSCTFWWARWLDVYSKSPPGDENNFSTRHWPTQFTIYNQSKSFYVFTWKYRLVFDKPSFTFEPLVYRSLILVFRQWTWVHVIIGQTLGDINTRTRMSFRYYKVNNF